MQLDKNPNTDDLDDDILVDDDYEEDEDCEEEDDTEDEEAEGEVQEPEADDDRTRIETPNESLGSSATTSTPEDHTTGAVKVAQCFQLHNMKARHREILRRHLLGEKVENIAKAVGMRRSGVNSIIYSPLFKSLASKAQNDLDIRAYDVMSELREIQPDAVNAIRESIKQTDFPNLRFQAARDLLNRTGATVPKELSVFKSTESYEQRLMSLRIEDDTQKPEPESYDDNDGITIIGAEA